jgi:hypothetical protein
MWPWYILAGVLTLGVGESVQKLKNVFSDEEPNTNEWGEIYDPITDTWHLPDVVIDKLENEKNRFKLNWREWDEAILGLGIFAVVMFSKPWK